MLEPIAGGLPAVRQAQLTLLEDEVVDFAQIVETLFEVGLVFCSLVLITGPIWAKPAWGVWWTWEARLTTTMLLWLLLVHQLEQFVLLFRLLDLLDLVRLLL